MKCHDYELDSEIFKSNEDLTLCRSDKVLVETNKGTLVVAIKDKERKVGYVFVGHGRLLVDAIVETGRGAFGKPIDRELKEPFLMLGNKEEIGQSLNTAGSDDLARIGLKHEEFLEKGQNLLDSLSNKKTDCAFDCSSEFKGLIFAFPANESRLDSLVAKDSKLVYTAKDMVFLSNGSKSIRTKSGQVVLSSDGRSLCVGKPHMSHTCC